MPVAAAPVAAHQVNAARANSTVPQDVANDLLGVHLKYRLQQFDLNIQKATDVIGVLDKYHYDTVSLKTTLAEIQAKRPALESAITAKNKDVIRAVNLEIINLWKEFGKNIKNVLKADTPP